MMETGRLGLWVCVAIVVASAVTDIRTRRIPNILTLGGIVVGIVLHAALGYADGGSSGALSGAIRALIGIAVCAAMPVLCFAQGSMGGGDVKLFAAIGALTGYRLGFDALASTLMVLVLIVAPIRIVRAGLAKTILRNLRTRLANVFRPAAQRAPYLPTELPQVIMGPTILVGTCLAMLVDGAWS
jgi:prepilin peptidase CpaA